MTRIVNIYSSDYQEFKAAVDALGAPVLVFYNTNAGNVTNASVLFQDDSIALNCVFNGPSGPPTSGTFLADFPSAVEVNLTIS